MRLTQVIATTTADSDWAELGVKEIHVESISEDRVSWSDLAEEA